MLCQVVQERKKEAQEKYFETLPLQKLDVRRRDPLSGSPIQKTARAHLGRNEIDLQIREILNMLYTLSATVEKQNQEIFELKELVKESLQSAPKTALAPQKPKVTMASRLSTSLQRSASSSDDTALTSNSSCSTQPAVSRGRPHVILDINGCDISVKEQPFSEIKKHLQSCLQNYEGTRTIVLKRMNKDAKKDHRYVLFFHTKEDEKAACIHIGRWLSLAFPRAFVQTTITHHIKDNNMRTDAIIDPVTNKARDEACHELSSSSGYAISRIGQLSGPGKRYGSMIVHFMQKEDADKVLAQGYLKLVERALVQEFGQKNRVSDDVLTASSMDILHHNVRMRRYMEIVQVQVIPIKSAQTPNKNSQTAVGNTAQMTITAQFFLIKMGSFHCSFLIRYGARFRFP